MPVSLVLLCFFKQTRYLPAFLYPNNEMAMQVLALRNGGITDLLWLMNKPCYLS